jgi:hypothetical protein
MNTERQSQVSLPLIFLWLFANVVGNLFWALAAYYADANPALTLSETQTHPDAMTTTETSFCLIVVWFLAALLPWLVLKKIVGPLYWWQWAVTYVLHFLNYALSFYILGAILVNAHAAPLAFGMQTHFLITLPLTSTIASLSLFCMQIFFGEKIKRAIINWFAFAVGAFAYYWGWDLLRQYHYVERLRTPDGGMSFGASIEQLYYPNFQWMFAPMILGLVYGCVTGIFLFRNQTQNANFQNN